jgi:hypothetical protein
VKQLANLTGNQYFTCVLQYDCDETISLGNDIWSAPATTQRGSENEQLIARDGRAKDALHIRSWNDRAYGRRLSCFRLNDFRVFDHQSSNY